MVLESPAMVSYLCWLIIGAEQWSHNMFESQALDMFRQIIRPQSGTFEP